MSNAFAPDHLLQAAALIETHRDVVETRVADDGSPPAWAQQREWTAWLSGLDALRLEELEQHGLHPVAEMPPSLIHMLEEVAVVTGLPALVDRRRDAPALFHAPAHKATQVAAFVDACRAHQAQPPSRVVDVGSGHGHLTRELAAALDVTALGVEWNADFVERARQHTSNNRVAFAAHNALAQVPPWQPGDLWVGLHACGALGDALVEHGARTRVTTALVGCCPQKRTDDVRQGFHARTPSLPRHALGLANVTPRVLGVEVDHAVDLAARAARLAVRNLLRERGFTVARGEEMQGINRRVARRGTEVLAQAAFAQRGAPPPSPAECARAQEHALHVQQAMRRWDLPRAWLGRAVEVLVALDRAWALHHAGMHVAVGTFVTAETTPRNIMVLARA